MADNNQAKQLWSGEDASTDCINRDRHSAGKEKQNEFLKELHLPQLP